MVRSAPILCVLSILLILSKVGIASERIVLWRVVQACVATHDLSGLPFPCLQVDTAHGVERGYVVLRDPFDASHIIVSPTVRTVGIEADRLRGANAPDYFADAWKVRHFATDGLPRAPGRDDLAMAINSRRGRSQDQLHIHVDCVRQGVRRSLAQAQASGALRPTVWTPIAPLPHAPRYQATPIDSADLQGINVFDLVARGLAVAPDEMGDMTIVVVGTSVPKPGFVILARRRIPDSADEAHGEALLDHSCSAFR